MTSELTLLVLRVAFLAVLWLFVFVVVYALRSDLFGSARSASDRPAGAGQQGQRPRRRPPTPALAVPLPSPLAPRSPAAPVRRSRDPPRHHHGREDRPRDAARRRAR